MAKIEEWMFRNKLKLNPDKTEFIVITSDRNKNKVIVPSLSVLRAMELPEAQIKEVLSIINLTFKLYNCLKYF
jgi:predicted metal-dependent TIM-barrel fold hydrolase